MIQAHTQPLIDFLNALLEVDRHAVAELLCVDVVCNEAMANHPTVQVRAGGFTTYQPIDQTRITLLGLLNGFCGVYEDTDENRDLNIVNWGPITAVYNNGQLEKFIETKVAKQQGEGLYASTLEDPSPKTED